MKYAYYPGCSLHSTAREYDVSLRSVCGELDIGLVEIRKWICCGSTPAHSLSKLVALALPLKNVELAEKAGMSDIMVPCAACFCRVKTALREVKNDSNCSSEVEKIIGSSVPQGIGVHHPLEIFSKPENLKKIANLKKKDMGGIKVACYYGCLLTRPPKVAEFDECEYPQSMDKVLRALGIVTLDWNYKTDCCGASLSLTITDIVSKLTSRIVGEAKHLGADAISVACPLCQVNLDSRQEGSANMPVLYFTQLLGLALGISADRLLLKKHLVRPEKFLNL